ncbi:hypothetical protein [Streptomyces sp. NBC_00576]|uniref:hypothetical protein n=1 Tax=Streptomyces sp. NBC_00576 TaxID=2903665 RepID=UPI002E812125|nr:hypothetical protein [Streptomyces sp. NBC_00576]WUB70573.1 hypothetical protein OG734_11020 [Streptomyces sp. NBC_00576]
MGIFLLLFWGGGACFSVWRARRLWTDPGYYQRVVDQRVFRFKDDVSRGLVRGWAPFSVGALAMLVAMVFFIVIGAGQHQHGSPSAAPVVALLLVLVFVIGIVLQLSIAWFNSPRWCVPPYLRQEAGAWAERHPRKVS